jgi:hypothetical protein
VIRAVGRGRAVFLVGRGVVGGFCVCGGGVVWCGCLVDPPPGVCLRWPPCTRHVSRELFSPVLLWWLSTVFGGLSTVLVALLPNCYLLGLDFLFLSSPLYI